MEGGPTQAVSYIEWLRESKCQPTFRSMLDADLRTAIQDANDLGHFFLLMSAWVEMLFSRRNASCSRHRSNRMTSFFIWGVIFGGY